MWRWSVEGKCGEEVWRWSVRGKCGGGSVEGECRGGSVEGEDVGYNEDEVGALPEPSEP